MVSNSQKSLRTVLRSVLTLSILFVGVALYFGQSSASATTTLGPNDCAVRGGDHSDYAGLVIETQYLNDAGQWVDAQGNNMSIQVATLSPSYSPPGNVVDATAAQIAQKNNSVTARVSSEDFRAISTNKSGYNCPRTTNTAVILRGDGYGSDGSGSPTTTSSLRDWVLDCDLSKRSSPQNFRVTGLGVPNGARSGGTWSAPFDVAPDNGTSEWHVMRYTPPQQWTLEGYSTVTSSSAARATSITASPSTSVTFFHDIKNLGPSKAGYQWKVQKNYAGAGWSDATSYTGTVTANKNAQNPNPATSSSAPYTITIPSNAATGSQYCQRIYFTNATGPSTAADYTTNPPSSPAERMACVTVAAPGNPTVTLSCSSTDILTGTANDPDHVGPYKVAFYKGGAGGTPVGSLNSTGSDGSFSLNVSSYSPAGQTFTVVATGKDASGADSGSAQASATCPNPPTGPACAGQNTAPTVTLPPAAPSNSPPPSYSRSPNQTYEQDIVQSNYRIDSADDSISGPEYAPPTSITWSPNTNPGFNNSGNFQLDYSNYVNQYPYDHHNTTIHYSQLYTAIAWQSASSPSGYTCDYGGGLSGSTCSYNYSATPYYWTCDDGSGTYGSCTGASYSGNPYYDCSPDSGSGYSTGGTCTRSDNSTYSVSPSYYYCHGRGGNYYFTSSSTCNDPSYTGSPTYYYCGSPPYGNAPSGSSSGSSTSSTCTYSYPGNPYYNYSPGPQQPNQIYSGAVYNGAPYLDQCFHRTFNAHDPAVTVSLAPDNESPSTANYQATVKVDFGYPPGDPVTNLRHRDQVTLNYTANYYYVPPGSSGDPSGGTPLPCSAPTSGTIYIPGGFGSSNDNTGSASTSCSQSPSFIPPVDVGGEICAEFTISPTGTEMDEYGTIIKPDNGQQLKAHNCSAPLVNEPYANFFGNDVRAGGSFNGAGGCTSGTAGGIDTYLRAGTDPRPRGSSAQLGALSLGPISGFSSASLRTGTPVANTGLTFANTGGSYGGSLGGSHCVPDFYGSKPSTANTTNPDINSVNGNASGAYAFTGPQTLDSTTLRAGITQAVYVNGDVYISNNITYDQSGWSIGADGKTNIPSFYLIVKGNIYIGANVTQLDGTYVAEGSGTSGVINTCASNTFAAYPAGDLYNNCTNQLTVNGTFIANTVKLKRTFSSLRHSDFGENPNAGASNHNCSISGGSSTDPRLDCAAEIFNFSPETYLSNPAYSPSSGLNSGKYDYIKSLSPVL